MMGRIVARSLPLLLVPVWLQGQEAVSSEPLDLMTAVERALAQYPTVQASRAAGEAAEAAVGRARAEWFPTITLAAAATQFEEPMVVTPIHGFDPGATPPFDETLIHGAATLAYTLFDGGARGARVRQARSEAGAAAAGTAAAERALIGVVVSTYLRALSTSRVLEAHDRRLAALRDEQDRVRQLLDAGRAARVEMLRVEAALANAEAERVQLAARLEVAERDLARLIAAPVVETRAPDLVPVALADTTSPPAEVMLGAALEQNAEVERARRDLTAADAGVGLARSGRWPQLQLVGTYIDRGSAEGDFTGEWNVGVELAYPIFTGGRVARTVTEAEARRRAAQERLRLAERTVAAEMDRVVSAVREARARVRSLATAVARSDEVARIEQLRLVVGSGTQTDYLAAEAELLAARAGLIEAQHTAIAAHVELARVVGELSPEWLAQNLEMER